MGKVLGVGGVFLKAADTAKTAAWYREVLGFDTQSWNGTIFQHPSVGKQVWSPFPADSDYFAPSTAPVMINLIVDDLDGVLAHAKAAGVEPVDRSDDDDNGRFAWIMDPDGYKLELWQPKG
jgi:catechol 2,3-dioxygenase-like lactoylglutathione lyase family enzyme